LDGSWSVIDQRLFIEGVFAFRRNFLRIQQQYLPHKTHKDVVAYFY
ncbi:unnamed protein product, partial [Phaeothamnion confervicola]